MARPTCRTLSDSVGARCVGVIQAALPPKEYGSRCFLLMPAKEDLHARVSLLDGATGPLEYESSGSPLPLI